MRRIQIAGLGIALITALALTGCGNDKSTAADTEAAESTQTMQSSESTDTVSAASTVNTPDGFVKAAGVDGTWIIIATEDIAVNEDIVIEGEFTHRDEIYRKLALYAQDADRNVTARYTLTAPRLTVRSENTRLQGGTFVGDVYVEANKFHIYDGTVDGDIYFASEEYQASFSLQEGGEVTGELQLQ